MGTECPTGTSFRDNGEINGLLIWNNAFLSLLNNTKLLSALYTSNCKLAHVWVLKRLSSPLVWKYKCNDIVILHSLTVKRYSFKWPGLLKLTAIVDKIWKSSSHRDRSKKSILFLLITLPANCALSSRGGCDQKALILLMHARNTFKAHI